MIDPVSSAENGYLAAVLAVLICAFGSIVAMRLFARARRTDGTRRANWLFLSGVVCGSSIWTTHFVAMFGYAVPVAHAYEPMGTVMSLFMAIVFSIIGMVMASTTRTGPTIEIGGMVLGAGIAVMHLVGMAALKVAGTMEWNLPLLAVAVVSGCLFGAIAMNRIARPVTRFCKYGGALALLLSVLTMHFIAMEAMRIVPDLNIQLPPNVISQAMLAICVLSSMALIMSTGLSSYLIDQHSQEEALGRYRHLALHDPVTGLPNRSFLTAQLTETIENARDDTARVAVIAIDLDRFKDINDVHGHAAGDHVLSTIAERITAIMGEGEFLARVGGDEFVAIKQDLYMRGDAGKFAERLRDLICEPIANDSRVVTVGASIGISLYPDDGTRIDDLTSKADLAMYRAKQSATTKICRYDPSMDETSRERSALAMELRDATERGEFELYYQPQNDVATSELIGFEVLLRWNHPRRGLVSPAEFIPIAEQTGLILSIGEWVLRAACQEAATWETPFNIAVNVASAQVLQSNLCKIVHESLVQSGLSPSRLELEITESSIIDDHQHALHVVRTLKSYGVRIAMDDYGTGYSSLSTLQMFPFDKIKIDRSFITSLGTNQQANAIVKATIILAESLNIPVLAEGVELERQLDFLRRQGCQEAQGYFFGKPVPLGQIRQLVGNRAGTGGLIDDRRADEPAVQKLPAVA